MGASLVTLNPKRQASLNHAGLDSLYHHLMSIGARFRQLRQHLKLSGEQIGEICGVTKGMVSQWESDTVTPPTDRLIALAEKHNFSMDWILLEKGAMIPDGLYVSDPKLIAACQLMEPMSEYAKDAAVKDVAQIAELVARTKANGKIG